MLLNEKQLDLLKELLNIGIGNSSATLHELVSMPIKLSVPTVALYPIEEFILPGKNSEEKMLTVKLEFSGTFSGISQIVFPLDSAANLVSILSGEDKDSTDFNEIKVGTLNEVANMLLNGVIGTMGNLLNDHFSYSLPTFHEMTWNGFHEANKAGGRYILFGNSHFEVADKDIEGDIILIFEMPSLQNLITVLNAMLGEE